jgi:hypothetical protein
VTTGADGTVPAGALDAVAGLASPDDATTVVLDSITAAVMLADVTTPFTVTEPLVNGLALLVHEICCPDGAPHTHPVPDAPTGTTPAGSVSVTVTGEFSAAPDADAVA